MTTMNVCHVDHKQINMSNKMRRRIADWAYSFWYNNHTHNWELYEPTMNWEKCKYCGKVQNFKPKQR